MAKKNQTRRVGNKPPYRKLRGYAFDPSSSLNLDTAEINQIVYKVPWENDLQPGPEGEYIKVVDRDPASNATYYPIDLNDPDILASDGLTPSETNPQFHQQMVYAVIMYTIKNFEKALGRKVLWSPVENIDSQGRRQIDFVQKLFVYPHAIRDQNAYYSPERKALLFGYYNATPIDNGVFLPGGIVYSCLSHDIIAHETTHALLDGMYSRYMELTHPDVAGFHEGFSDIVALLQHFTYPEIVKNQIRMVKGVLDTENMLAKLAVEFGQSTGEYHSLRDGIGQTDENGNWQRRQARVTDYESNLECHDRGALLVAAVFDAFNAIYKSRTADLVRLATGGTGVVPAGEIHPDLVNRLADEAVKVAAHVLNMCVRALDYCPPVDLNYGDYLRALITADKELVASDDHNYRIAFINAFRKRGIFPEDVPNLSVDTLCYNAVDDEGEKAGFSDKIVTFLRQYKESLAYKTDRRQIFDETKKFITGSREKNIPGFHSYLFKNSGSGSAAAFEDITGLVLSPKFKDFGIRPSQAHGPDVPAIEIQSLRILNKTGPGGSLQNQIIMSLVQSCKVAVTEDAKGKRQFKKFRYGNRQDEAGESMIFRGGCTLIFDLDDLTLRHSIRKPIFNPCEPGSRRKLEYNKKRLEMQYRCLQGDLVDKIGFAAHRPHNEPFAFIHQAKNPII
jgi:hypothetical protein